MKTKFKVGEKVYVLGHGSTVYPGIITSGIHEKHSPYNVYDESDKYYFITISKQDAKIMSKNISDSLMLTKVKSKNGDPVICSLLVEDIYGIALIIPRNDTVLKQSLKERLDIKRQKLNRFCQITTAIHGELIELQKQYDNLK